MKLSAYRMYRKNAKKREKALCVFTQQFKKVLEQTQLIFDNEVMKENQPLYQAAVDMQVQAKNEIISKQEQFIEEEIRFLRQVMNAPFEVYTSYTTTEDSWFTIEDAFRFVSDEKNGDHLKDRFTLYHECYTFLSIDIFSKQIKVRIDFTDWKENIHLLIGALYFSQHKKMPPFEEFRISRDISWYSLSRFHHRPVDEVEGVNVSMNSARELLFDFSDTTLFLQFVDFLEKRRLFSLPVRLGKSK